MPVQEHCFADGFFVQGQRKLDGGHGLGECKYPIHAKLDVSQPQHPFKLLVDLQSDEAYADMCLYPPAGEVEHRAYLYL